MKEKKCARCKIIKGIENFKDKKTKIGNITKSCYCNDCVKIMSYESYQRNYRVKFPPIINLTGINDGIKWEEEWQPIPINGLGLYKISSCGRIKTIGHHTTKKNGHRCFHQERLLTQTVLDDYFQVSLLCNGKSKTFRMSRLVAITFHPNPENKPEVNHKDGIKKNNFASNLEWNTKSENNVHARINKLMPEKLSEKQVLAIFSATGKAKVIAAKYGVTDNTVYEIKSGKTRSRITGKKYIRSKDADKFVNKKFKN